MRRACVLFYDLLLCVCVLLGCDGCVLGLMVVCACLVGVVCYSWLVRLRFVYFRVVCICVLRCLRLIALVVLVLVSLCCFRFAVSCCVVLPCLLLVLVFSGC